MVRLIKVDQQLWVW